MTNFVRTWVLSVDANKRDSDTADTLWIYDAGDKQGHLVEYASGKKSWTLYQIESREYLSNGNIQETGTILSDADIPLHFFSKESYQVSVVKDRIYLDNWSVLTTTGLQPCQTGLQQQKKQEQQSQQPSPSRPQQPKSVTHRKQAPPQRR